MSMASYKHFLKFLLKPLIYRFPPIMLLPERLMLWQQTLIETIDLDGDVVEVGCYLGGTAAVATKMMRDLGNNKHYRAYDTFSGFTGEQWAAESAVGVSSDVREEFSCNSPALTRWVLDRHGGKDVSIHQGDIATLPESEFPTKISACLLDVDLTEPIYLGLSRLYPKLQEGGTILVDDCNDGGWYKAKIGYERYMRELKKPPVYMFGMGILRK
jgi:hypothetical protein